MSWDHDDPFYRIYQRPEDLAPIVVCVQSFDLQDYNEDWWVNDVDYATEDEAQAAIWEMLPKIVVSGEAYDELIRLLDAPPRDLPALRALIKGREQS